MLHIVTKHVLLHDKYTKITNRPLEVLHALDPSKSSYKQRINNKNETDKYSQDMTKWKLVDRIGNIFNRLILFNSNRFHMSMDYFGDKKENGRLFQVFFFSTEY